MSGALDRELRKGLAKAARSARRIAEAGAKAALGALRVGAAQVDPSLSAEDRALRKRLRAHARALGDPTRGAEQGTDRLGHEVAYGHWHRMLFARFLAENDLLIEPASGVAVSLDECRELARDRNEELWTMVGGFAERMLPRIFRPDDPSLAVHLAPETQQALEKTLEDLPTTVFRADDALGWSYQFWQTDAKEKVNKSGLKIGADELPAVTQLFTERYMVRFLFHNTLGTWRAEKVLALRRQLVETAEGETALRQAVRLEAAGGYEFDYLRFVRESPDGEDTDNPGRWRPAAGSFAEWPRRAADLKVLDPCCGSGHFLVEGLHLFVRLRMEEENLSLEAAIRAVLRHNLHGLEIDPRCAQIAAFALAFAAWKLAERVIELPPLNIACSGLAPNATKEEWLLLAERTAATAGSAPRNNLFERRETSQSSALRETFRTLHDLFVEAPTLGSLINPRAAGASLFAAGFDSVRSLVESVFQKKEAPPDAVERTVAAAGMVRAASLLAGTYSLVITNFPYLGRGRQSSTLQAFADKYYSAAKPDLATMFLERSFGWLAEHGAQAVVVPHNWLFLNAYTKLREGLLTRRRWHLVVRLGPGAFETIGGHVVNAALTVMSSQAPVSDCQIAGLDVSGRPGQTPTLAAEKAAMLRGSLSAPGASGEHSDTQRVRLMRQTEQLHRPDSVVTTDEPQSGNLLITMAAGVQGLATSDNSQFILRFWEMPDLPSGWEWFQTAPEATAVTSGCSYVLHWQSGKGTYRKHAMALKAEGRLGGWQSGKEAWGRSGIAVNRVGKLPVSLYGGGLFDCNVAIITPSDFDLLPAVWEFCKSSEYSQSVRRINQKLAVTNVTLTKVPFDVRHWTTVARVRYPQGLPEPYTNDPTQWVFHGHPWGSVVWDSDAKRTAEGPARTDKTALHVAVARLLGYRWPAERDSDLRLADEARGLVRRCEPLAPFADTDGIVCLPAVRGGKPAADRLRPLLVAAYGDAWSGAVEQRLLSQASVGAKPARSLDDWLRNHFFEEHCRLFHHRPFVWHVWDGLPGGFSALVNYHRLAGPDGEGRRTLESLAYSYLGDWIDRQRAALRQEIPGADARLVAALELKAQFERILVGEPPLDLFVRWKPLHEQPIGWEPDINDGARLNIRPFLRAALRNGGKKGTGILGAKPNIKWTKDRGKEPQHLKPEHKDDAPQEHRPKADFPWFWSCPGDGPALDRTDFPGGPAFDGARWNDLHYTNAAKRAARNRPEVGSDPPSSPNRAAPSEPER